MEATAEASRTIAVGDASLMVSGGVESMSRAPWVMLKPERPYPRAHETLWSTTLGWRMVNPRCRDEWTVSLGEGAEILADRYRISREEQDEFAIAQSPQRGGGMGPRRLRRRGGARAGHASSSATRAIRADSSLEKLAKLKPAFRKEGGTVTAGNSSPLNDGAAALLLGDEAGAQAAGREPLARIASRAVSGVEPQLYGIGPVEAANKALARAGIGWDELDARRAQRGVRRAVARVPARVDRARSRDRQPQRRRDRDRPPARVLGRAPAHLAGPRAAPPRRRVGARDDVHRRGPGHRHGPGGVTTGALFAPLFVPDALRDAVSDEAYLAAMLEFEAALAAAEARAGVIPPSAAEAIAAACDPARFDLAELGRAGVSSAAPVAPLAKALRAQLPEEARSYAHWGATSQDVLDTATMLVARRALRLVIAELDGVAAACRRAGRRASRGH